MKLKKVYGCKYTTYDVFHTRGCCQPKQDGKCTFMNQKCTQKEFYLVPVKGTEIHKWSDGIGIFPKEKKK